MPLHSGPCGNLGVRRRLPDPLPHWPAVLVPESGPPWLNCREGNEARLSPAGHRSLSTLGTASSPHPSPDPPPTALFQMRPQEPAGGREVGRFAPALASGSLALSFGFSGSDAVCAASPGPWGRQRPAATSAQGDDARGRPALFLRTQSNPASLRRGGHSAAQECGFSTRAAVTLLAACLRGRAGSPGLKALSPLVRPPPRT